MTGIITEIMVEVLRIFGIATKELRRGSASKFSDKLRLNRQLTILRQVSEEIGRNG